MKTGLSGLFHGSGFTGSGEVRLASEIALLVYTRGRNPGAGRQRRVRAGTNTTFAQIVAETCKIPPDWVEIHEPDTAEVPDSGPDGRLAPP